MSAAIPEFAAQLAAAFAEDLGGARDITSQSVIPSGSRLKAVMAARDGIVLAGVPIAEAAFRFIDPGAQVVRVAEDGASLEPGSAILTVEGDARGLLAAERTALNFVQHLSGIATLTRAYADAIAGTGAILLDTRKTIPGLRLLEKYAVRMGGGANHRMGLHDAVLIKDNHIAVVGGVKEAVRRARSAGHDMIEVEVDSIDQIEPALEAGATRLLLDNMGPPMLREALAIVAGRVPTEASGGVRLDNIRAIAETGVTFVSVGRLTQSAPAADIGLDYLTG